MGESNIFLQVLIKSLKSHNIPIMLNKILCKLPTHMLFAMTTYKFQSSHFSTSSGYNDGLPKYG